MRSTSMKTALQTFSDSILPCALTIRLGNAPGHELARRRLEKSPSRRRCAACRRPRRLRQRTCGCAPPRSHAGLALGPREKRPSRADRLYIHAINRHLTDGFDVNADLSAFTVAASPGRHHLYTGDPSPPDDPRTDGQVTTITSSDISVASSSAVLKLPPHSASIFELPLSCKAPCCPPCQDRRINP